MKKNNAEDQLALGIDIGGSHITVGLVNLAMKNIVSHSVQRKKVNRHATAEEILGTWSETINEMQTVYAGSFNRVGFAMPGPFDYENGVCLIKGFDKYESLYGLNIREELAKRTDIAAENIIFRNDADAFLAGEFFCGSVQGFHKAVGVTLGTGLGSCIYENGTISNAGLNVFPFNDGIAEDYVSSRWFEKIYFEYTGKKMSGVKSIADIYREDEIARKVFGEFAINLAVVLKHSIRTFNPEVIVLGGNISNAFDLFFRDMMNELTALCIAVPKIVKAILGENAALIGSACNFKSYKISSASLYHDKNS